MLLLLSVYDHVSSASQFGLSASQKRMGSQASSRSSFQRLFAVVPAMAERQIQNRRRSRLVSRVSSLPFVALAFFHCSFCVLNQHQASFGFLSGLERVFAGY